MRKKPEFKYNLNHLFSLAPRYVTNNDMVSNLKKAGIPERTFYRDRALLLSSDGDIPGERLMIYAMFFNTTVEELANYKVRVTPMVRMRTRTLNMNFKTGLS